VSGVPIRELVEQLGRQVLDDLDDPNGVISAFQSFAGGGD
jgi:hypothetical protein